MNERLKKLIQAKEDAKTQRKAEFDKDVENAKDSKELRSAYTQYNTDIKKIDDEIKELRSLADSMPDDTPKDPEPQPPIEGRGKEKAPQGKFNPLGTYGTEKKSKTSVITSEHRAIDDVLQMPTATPEQKTEMRAALFETPEYRSAFLKDLSGRPASMLTDSEKRALTTAANSGGAAVPTTTYNKIVERMNQTSALFPLINKSFIPGNVTLPVADPQTSADWTDEAPTSDKDDTLSEVSLSAFPLSKFAKVKGQLILMAIDAFETYIVKAIGDQLAIAVENAIINGKGASPQDGSKPQPLGMLSGITFDSSNSLTYNKGGAVSYDNLVDLRALLKLYRTPSAKWIMNSNMEAQLFKIKTTTNQPLFTQNPITGLISNPLGIPYVVDYYMPDGVILLANLDYYYMNINQNPIIIADDSAGFTSTSRIYRGTMFADGKPALNSAFVKLSEATV